MDTGTIEQEALHLPLPARAELVRKLLQSLDETSDCDTDNHWLEESSRRAEEIDSGAVKLVPSDVVRAKALALLK